MSLGVLDDADKMLFKNMITELLTEKSTLELKIQKLEKTIREFTKAENLMINKTEKFYAEKEKYKKKYLRLQKRIEELENNAVP